MRLVFLMTSVLACGSDLTPGATDAPATIDGPPDAIAPIDCSAANSAMSFLQQAAQNPANSGKSVTVLAHGAFGFDRAAFIDYWGGADEALRDAGFPTFVTVVEPVADSLATRGNALAEQIACIAQQTGAAKVNVIAHSQGGMDARVVASHSPYAAYIATIATLSTPHRGTKLADVASGAPGVSKQVADGILRIYESLLGSSSNASFEQMLEETSVANAAVFNAQTPDNPSVQYFSWAGRSARTLLSSDRDDKECAGSVLPNPDDVDAINPTLYAGWEYLEQTSGGNDGVVSIESAKWGTFMGCVALDHLDQIGMLSVKGGAHRRLIVDIAGRLQAAGN